MSMSRSAVEMMLESGLSLDAMRDAMRIQGMSEEDINLVLTDLPSYNAYSDWLAAQGTVGP